MGLIESIFKNQISKAVNSQLASNFAGQYANSLDKMVAFMNTGLPTINPDGHDYYQTFKTIGAVYETTDLISKKVIGSPFVFYKVKDKKKLQQSKRLEKTDPVQSYLLKLQATQEVDNTLLMNLLANPNPYQTGTQFLWTVCLSYLLYGNSYLHATFNGKRATELYCFPNMRIVADMDDLLDPIRGYELMNTDSTKFTKEEIYHMKTGNPAAIDRTLEYLYGVSPLRSYLEPMRTIEEANKQSSKQAKNGGTFGVLAPENPVDDLSDPQKQQLKDKMSQARRSDDEMARVFISSIKLAWEQIGLPIGDLQLIELVGAKEEAVYRAFHVPLQYHNQKASTSNNQSAAIKQLVYDAVSPQCEAIGEALTRFLGKGFEDVVIELDYTQLPEMAVNMKEVQEYIIPLVEKGLITPDEGRLALKYGETNLDFMKEYYTGSAQTTRRRVFDGTNNTPPITTTT